MPPDAVAVRPSTYASPARRHAVRSSRSQRVARMKARTNSPPPDLRIQGLKGLFEIRGEQDSRSLDSRQGLIHNAVSTGAVNNGYKRSGWASLRRSTAAIKSPDREPSSAPESTVKGATADRREGFRHAGGQPGSWGLKRVLRRVQGQLAGGCGEEGRFSMVRTRGAVKRLQEPPARIGVEGPTIKRAVNARQATSTVHQRCSPVI